MANLTEQMPKMLMGKELEEAMVSLPPYNPQICNADAAARIMALGDIAYLYIPSSMSFEIYSKIYLAMLHSLKKKQSVEAVRQGNQNHRRIQGLNYNSVLGGADSFSIIGPSGIGKSTALAKSIALSGGEQIIMTNNPYAQIIPCINVQCPHDCSVKGLLLAILSQVDMAIGTNYRQSATKYKASIDNIIGMVSQVGNKLADKYYRKCKKEGRETKGILNTYLTGFCAGIKEVLDKQSTALMVIVPKEVEESYQEYSKGFRQISNKLRTSNDGRAYQDGKQDGRETATARTIEG